MHRMELVRGARREGRRSRPDFHSTPVADQDASMPINPDAVGATSDPVQVEWNSKDALLYAVGIGAGTDELSYTTENTSNVAQQVFPTFPVVIGWGGGGAMAKI